MTVFRKHDYNREKDGWVKFKQKMKKKIKLRTFVSNIAKQMASSELGTYDECKKILIDAYNIGGMNGMKTEIDLQFKIKKGV